MEIFIQKQSDKWKWAQISVKQRFYDNKALSFSPKKNNKTNFLVTYMTQSSDHDLISEVIV